MTNCINIILADDHPLFLKGLLNELIAKNYHVVDVATTGTQALELIAKNNPDIAILDIKMPLLSGIDVIHKVRNDMKDIKTKFIVLTSYKEKSLLFKAKQLRVEGYLLKEEPFEEIEKCILKVVKGETYYSRSFDHIFENDIDPQLNKLKLLTPSERLILKLIAQSKSSKEIAEELLISPRTVQKHRSNIIHKLEIEDHENHIIAWSASYKEIILSLS